MNKRLSLAESLRQAARVSEPPAPVAVPTAATPPTTLPATTPRATAGVQAATRAGKKKVTAPLSPDDHKRLRHLALDLSVTTEALLVEAITDLFAKHGVAGVGQGSRSR